MTSDAMAFPLAGFDHLPITSLHCTIDVDVARVLMLDAWLRCDCHSDKCTRAVW